MIMVSELPIRPIVTIMSRMYLIMKSFNNSMRVFDTSAWAVLFADDKLMMLVVDVRVRVEVDHIDTCRVVV